MNGKIAPIDAYLHAVRSSLFASLRRNQTVLGWQREIRESPKYKDIEKKLTEQEDSRFSEARKVEFRDRIWQVVDQIKTSRMTQFLEKGRAISPRESEELKASLEPYLSLLPPVSEILQMQVTLTTQAHIKRLPLQYAELEASFKDITSLMAQLPKTLFSSVCASMETAEELA